jgi:hypothetical protein
LTSLPIDETSGEDYAPNVLQLGTRPRELYIADEPRNQPSSKSTGLDTLDRSLGEEKSTSAGVGLTHEKSGFPMFLIAQLTKEEML